MVGFNRVKNQGRKLVSTADSESSPSRQSLHRRSQNTV